jgi:toxin ParE1/3/4
LRRLRVLPSAKADLVEILDYVTRKSGSVATGRRFVAALRAQCRHLAELPGILGRRRPELRPDIRSFPFRNYVIFFRYVDEDFEVVNILEGHRDFDQQFGSDD